MAIGNEELMHECFLKHSGMGRARMKKDKVTEVKKRELSVERCKADTKVKKKTRRPKLF